MKCVNHPNRYAVAILNRRIIKEHIEHPPTIDFQIGVCIKCFNDWLEEREMTGYDIGETIPSRRSK